MESETHSFSSQRLCQACQSIFATKPPFPILSADTIRYGGGMGEYSTPQQHHENTAALVEAAEQGCALCSQIWRRFIRRRSITNTSGTFGRVLFQIREISASVSWLERPVAKLAFIFEDLDLPHYSRVSRDSVRDEDPRIVIFMFYPKSSKSHTSQGTYMSLTKRVLDSRIARKIPLDYLTASVQWRAWITKCISTHQKCRADNSSNFMPTRLVNVGFGATSGQQIDSEHVFLRISASMPIKERYGLPQS
jgi:hypothetical protein